MFDLPSSDRVRRWLLPHGATRGFLAGVLLLATAALASPKVIHRCGLDAFPEGWKPSPAPVRGQHTQTQVAARSLASTVFSFQTDHYILWWTMSGTDAITGNGAAVEAGDSVPGLVRSAGTALEAAWHLYVDTLGYLPPIPAGQGLHWGYEPPSGKYPVEICEVGNALLQAGGFAVDSNSIYYGVTVPIGYKGASNMMLASDLATFGGWSDSLDARKGIVGSNYSLDWSVVMQATASHEEFHSVQYNYDIQLDHDFLFEASAVTMEKVAVPAESDYLVFLAPDYGGLCGLQYLSPLLESDHFAAYPHAWYIKQLVEDQGIGILHQLWAARANSTVPIVSTLDAVFSQHNLTFDTTLARYALRVALSGRRSNWLLPNFASFPDDTLFPRLQGVIRDTSTPEKVLLDYSQFAEWIDTLGNKSDRIVDWIPDAGANLAHAWKSGAASGSERLRGSIRQAASSTRQDVWAFSNPGPLPADQAAATSEGSKSWLWVATAPTRTPVSSTKPFQWKDTSRSATGGSILSGTSAVDTTCTPLLHTDIWTPTASEEPFADSVVASTGSHSLVLEDADRILSLKNASLAVPYPVKAAWVGRGDGIWSKDSVSDAGSGARIELGTLDLSLPLRILASAGKSASVGGASAPYPNPSRAGAPIHFLVNSVNGATLEILGADGTCIRRLEVPPGPTSVDWDVKNGSGSRVKSGVYWYVWRGVSGANRGELIVARD